MVACADGQAYAKSTILMLKSATFIFAPSQFNNCVYYVTRQDLFHYCRIKWAYFCNSQKYNNILRTEDISENTTRGYFVLTWLIFAGLVTN